MSVAEFIIRYWSMFLGAIVGTIGIISKLSSYMDKKNKTLIAINEIKNEIKEQNIKLSDIQKDRMEDKEQLQKLDGAMEIVQSFIVKNADK